MKLLHYLPLRRSWKTAAFGRSFAILRRRTRKLFLSIPPPPSYQASPREAATWTRCPLEPLSYTHRIAAFAPKFSAGSLSKLPPYRPDHHLLHIRRIRSPNMSSALSPPAPPPSIAPHAHLSAALLPPMSILRCLAPLHLRHPRRRRLASVAAAVRQDTAVWTPAPLSLVESAAESLFHVSIDVSDAPELAGSHARPGQYLQLRVPDAAKPAFLAIASPPSLAAARGEFEFLVKSVAGSTAEALCGLKRGDVVELSQVMGKGFDIDRIEPPEDHPSVFIFATGSGISPIRSLIESGFGADKRSDVRLYYGARNLQRMAYQDRFKEWELSGVKIVPVLSQPDDSWSGETGYVQAAFNRAKMNFSPQSTGAVLCGQKQMTEEITSILVADGVSSEKILKNF